MSSLFCRSKTGKFHKKSGETFDTEVKDECTGDSAGTLRMSFTLCTVATFHVNSISIMYCTV